MAKAKRVHSTPRRIASKIQSKKRAKVKRPDDGREAALARREGRCKGSLMNVIEFPGREPATESYDDDGNLRHAEHFRCLHTRIDDCASMSLFAMAEMEKHDDGANPQLTFAVYHLVEMVHDLKRHYHAAYKGEIEP